MTTKKELEDRLIHANEIIGALKGDIRKKEYEIGKLKEELKDVNESFGNLSDRLATIQTMIEQHLKVYHEEETYGESSETDQDVRFLRYLYQKV